LVRRIKVMKKNRSKLTTYFLIIITLGLTISIFYISQLLINNDNNKKTIAPKKIKASSITYSKIINLKENIDNPTVFLSSTTNNQLLSSLTPTEIVIAYNSTTNEDISNDEESTITNALTATTSQKITSIPNLGSIYQTLVIFASASLFIFFAFLL